MAGLIEPGLFRSAHRAVYLKNLVVGRGSGCRQGVTILIEPINDRDMPGYFVHRQDEAHADLRGNRSAKSARAIRLLSRANR